MTQSRRIIVLAVCGVIVGGQPQWAPAEITPPPTTSQSSAPATRPVTPKALSENVQKGLAWLVKNQCQSGGWCQGEESANMRGGGSASPGAENVADTSAAVLALMRAGSTPTQGPHSTHIRKGIEFICDSVAKSPAEGMFITDARGTRLQSKLGQYVDTFLAALVLAEVKDKMGDDKTNKQVLAALDKTLDKMEKNQQKDGGWANQGWAPALAQGIAAKAVNRAEQQGAGHSFELRKKTEQYAQAQFDVSSGAVTAAGNAGVELYSRSSNLGSLKDADDSNQLRETAIKAVLASPTTAPADKARAQAEMDGIQQTRKELSAATQAVVQRMEDKQFVAGFGSNGGEEFLSHMNIGEALVSKGGAEWEKWDKAMTENLNRIQDDDGSWSGHHCITGKTFCTSAALLVLTVDRTATPLAEKIKKS